MSSSHMREEEFFFFQTHRRKRDRLYQRICGYAMGNTTQVKSASASPVCSAPRSSSFAQHTLAVWAQNQTDRCDYDRTLTQDRSIPPATAL
jgi:hypothetical protein